MKVRIFTFLFAAVFSTGVLASGFQINESGARAMGLAGAFTALANDPSAVYFNPAGITQLYGLHFSMGATYISPMSEYKGPTSSAMETTSKLKEKFFTPINFFYTQQLTDKIFVGFSVNNPYGLGTEWEEDWVGKYIAVETEIRTFNFAPVVAYKFSEDFSASVGFVVSYGDVLINRKFPVVITPGPGYVGDGTVELEGDAVAYGYRAGVLYKPMDNLSLGLTFRSEVEYEFEGEATSTFMNNTNPAGTPQGNISAPLTTPMTLAFGAAYNFSESFLMSADFQYNGWSSYDKLEITFESYPNANGSVSSSARDYENGFIARLGAEYVLNEKTSLRGGLLYDKNPVKDERLDPTLPDADRLGYNIGFSYKLTEYLSLDVAYLFLQFMEREITTSEIDVTPLDGPAGTALNGTYNSSAHLIGANINLSF